MDLYPKFIIEGDALILSKVTYHRDMVKDRKAVKGGGWFRYSSLMNTFTFYGESEDFGKAKFEDIKACVENGKVFDSRRSIVDNYSFAYDTGTEVINLYQIK